MKRASEGQIIAAHGRQYEVELADGSLLLCFTRGKKSHVACGDRVVVEAAGKGQGVIVSVAPRRTLLYRSDVFRQKLIAANATQAVIVTAVKPSFSEELVSRCLVAAEHQGMRALLVLNKIDLPEGVEEARTRLRPLRALGYEVVELHAKASIAPLRPHLHGQLSVLVGQSGMGKSTIINALVPGARAATREVSEALDSGKHTTTHTRLYRLDADSAVIDSPGMQEFGLAHLSEEELQQAFVEFRPYLGRCRFRDCHHDAEPGCAVRAACEAGAVSPQRLALFQSIRKANAEAARFSA